MADDNSFTPEQKEYLQGFMSGVDSARTRQGLKPLFDGAAPGGPGDAEGGGGPEAAHIAAQNRFLAEGKKLANEETAKREEHPFDIYERMKTVARAGEFPKGVDVFRWKFHGLFYVAPAQDCFMCRLRIPNGVLTPHQFAGVAGLAERFGGGYAHVTTRANLQVREIGSEGLCDLGLTARGSGADNIRNITGGPLAGIDPVELIDTRPLARELHFHILNKRELYGLPRKFNIAFDGGGQLAVLEDTNDIGFQAVAVPEDKSVPAGVYFRLGLGGITGHQDFAKDTGLLLRPEQCLPVADAIIRVFIASGDRTNRNKARLKYVLDDWGLEKFVAETEKQLGYELARVPLEDCTPRAPLLKHGHVGVHPQAQDGLNYIGLALPVGKMTSEQMREIAGIAHDVGGDIRLTVWQNLIVSNVPDDRLDEIKQRIEDTGLHWSATNIRAGLIACTGNQGCKFALSDTKGHAMEIAAYLEERLELDQPVNIHLTGCPNSCAQHYIGDIGLLGTKVDISEDEEVEGYTIFVGGGFGSHASIARKIYADVKAEDAPAAIERMFRAYLAHRDSPEEDFQAFTARHEIEDLRRMAGEAGGGS
jgi:ferredoxin-nitrite reductase